MDFFDRYDDGLGEMIGGSNVPGDWRDVSGEDVDSPFGYTDTRGFENTKGIDKMWLCRECHQTNDPSAFKCQSCGSEYGFGNDEWTCPHCNMNQPNHFSECEMCEYQRPPPPKPKPKILPYIVRGDNAVEENKYPEAIWFYFWHKKEKLRGQEFSKIQSIVSDLNDFWEGFDIFLNLQYDEKKISKGMDFPEVKKLWIDGRNNPKFMKKLSPSARWISNKRKTMNIGENKTFLQLGTEIWLIVMQYWNDDVADIARKHRNDNVKRRLSLRNEGWCKKWLKSTEYDDTNSKHYWEQVEENWKIIIVISMTLVRSHTTETDFSRMRLYNPGFDLFLAYAISNKLPIQNLIINFACLDTDGITLVGSFLKNNSHLKLLKLSGNRINNKGAIALAEGIKANTTLTALDISNNQNITYQGGKSLCDAIMGGSSISKLSECFNVAKLRNNEDNSLELKGRNIIGDTEGLVLASLLKINTKLTQLRINNAKMSDECAIELAKSILSNEKMRVYDDIQIMHLKNNSVSGDTKRDTLEISTGRCVDLRANIIAGILKVNTTVTSLVLSDKIDSSEKINFGHATTQALVEAVLKNNSIRSFGHISIADLESQTKKMILSSKGIGNIEIMVLGDRIKSNEYLEKLDLSKNKIGDVGARYLADGLRENTTITVVNLDHNLIGDKGVELLINIFLNSKTIKSLSIKKNREISIYKSKELATKLLDPVSSLYVENYCGIPIAAYLQNDPSHIKANFRNKNISNSEAIVLCSVLQKNSTVTELDLRRNQITDDASEWLISLVQKNVNIRFLYLYENKIGDITARGIANALKKNKTLLWLHLQDNNITDHAAKDIADALKKNDTLQDIDLRYNKFSKLARNVLLHVQNEYLEVRA